MAGELLLSPILEIRNVYGRGRGVFSRTVLLMGDLALVGSIPIQHLFMSFYSIFLFWQKLFNPSPRNFPSPSRGSIAFRERHRS